MISCAKMCSPEHHENNAILTSSAVPFHCRYRRLLERIPFFLALCLRPAVNWRPSGSRDMFVCGCSWSSWVEAVTRGWHPNSCNSFTSSGLAPGETRAREMWVRMVLLLLIQWGALREGTSRMVAGRRSCHTTRATRSFSVAVWQIFCLHLDSCQER